VKEIRQQLLDEPVAAAHIEKTLEQFQILKQNLEKLSWLIQSSITDNKNQLSLLWETRSGCALPVSEHANQAKNLVKRKSDPILLPRLSTEMLINSIYLPIYKSGQSLILTN